MFDVQGDWRSFLIILIIVVVIALAGLVVREVIIGDTDYDGDGALHATPQYD